jgi:hypothetical protein
MQRELRRRSFPLELDPFIRTDPWREWGRQIAPRLGLAALARGDASFLSANATFRALDRRVARRLTPVRCDCAFTVTTTARSKHSALPKAARMITIYEHPITYWRKVRRLQEEEADLHPEWKPTLLASTTAPKKLRAKTRSWHWRI